MQLIQNETHFSLFGTTKEFELLKDIIAGADPYKYGHKDCEKLYKDFALTKAIIHRQISEHEWEVSFPKSNDTLGRKDLEHLFPDYHNCFFSAYLYEKDGRSYYRVGRL